MLQWTKKFFLIVATVIVVVQNSTPIATQPDPTYLTGMATLITSNMGSTSPVLYTLTYPWTMSTASLNGTLGIVGVNYYISGYQFGWNLGIVSLTALTMVVQVKVYHNYNPLFYLNICYMVTYNSYLDTNYVSYSFSKYFKTKVLVIRLITMLYPLRLARWTAVFTPFGRLTEVNPILM